MMPGLLQNPGVPDHFLCLRSLQLKVPAVVFEARDARSQQLYPAALNIPPRARQPTCAAACGWVQAGRFPPFPTRPTASS
jgi:hypothetical protein